MNIITGDNTKKWILALILSLIVFLQYSIKFLEIFFDMIPTIQSVLFLVFFILFYIFSFQKKQIVIRTYWYSFFILLITIFNISLVLIFPEGNNIGKLSNSLGMLVIFLSSLLIIVNINRSILLSVLFRFYLVAFTVGIFFIGLTYFGIILPNEILNENTIGFLLAPFLINVFITHEQWRIRMITFIIGSILISISDAKTTLVAFVLLPLFMFIQIKVKKPRLMFFSLIIFGLILVSIPTYIHSTTFTSILSYRDVLWSAYMKSASKDIFTFICGVGSWGPETIGIPRFEGFKAHNTFISLLHLNGLVAVILYINFILYGIRKYSNSFSVSDGLLFLTITFQLAESNVPLFSFVFPSFVFMINLFLNHEEKSRSI